MNSYSLRQPITNKSIGNKRVKKNDPKAFIRSTAITCNSNSNVSFFEYYCFNCNASQSLPTELMDNYEIECSDCGCRIFRKPRIKKKLEVEAI